MTLSVLFYVMNYVSESSIEFVTVLLHLLALWLHL